jgi:hypothetical protein
MYRIHRKLILFFYLQLVSISMLIAQTVSVQTELDTNRILLGRFVNLKYTITKEPGQKIVFPIFHDSLCQNIDVVGEAKIDSLSDNKSVQSLVITSYEPGQWQIAPQPFVIKTSAGTDTIYSTVSLLQVDSVAIDTTGVIRDIKKVEWIMPSFSDFIPLLIALAIIGLIIVLVMRYWPGSKKVSQKATTQVIEPPHVIAMRELDKLKAQKLWQQKQTKEYYSRLTAIIRTYIEQQFGLKAMEQTSAEIIRDIHDKGLETKLNISDLKKLLNLADLIKFAKGNAQPEENIEHLERAYDFVKSSRQAVMEEAVKSATDVVKDNLSNSYQIAKKSRNAKGLSDLQIIQELEKGGRLVRYQYSISIIVRTFSLNSKIHLLKVGEKGVKPGIIFSVITIFLGWWGIPWGPIRSVRSLKNNFSGGKDVDLGGKIL